MAAMGAAADSTNLPKAPSSPNVVVEMTDTAGIASQLIGLPRKEIEARYTTKLEHFAGSEKPTLIIGAQQHLVDRPEVRFHAHEIEKSQRALVPLIVSLYHRNKISCVFHESVVDEVIENEVIADARKMISFLQTEREYLNNRPTISIMDSLDNGETQRFEQVLQALSIVVNLIENGARDNLPRGGFDMTTYHLFAPIANDIVTKLVVMFSVLLPEFEEKYGRYRPQIDGFKKRMSDLWSNNGEPNSELLPAPVYLRVFTDIPIKVCPTMSLELHERWRKAKERVADAETAHAPYHEQENEAINRIRALVQEIEALNKESDPRKTISDRLRILNTEIPRAQVELVLARENIKKYREEGIRLRREELDLVEMDERNHEAVSFVLNSNAAKKESIFFLQMGKMHVSGIASDMAARPKDFQMNVLSIGAK